MFKKKKKKKERLLPQKPKGRTNERNKMPCCALYIQPCVLCNFENTKARRVVDTGRPHTAVHCEGAPPKQSASLPPVHPTLWLTKGKGTGTDREYT